MNVSKNTPAGQGNLAVSTTLSPITDMAKPAWSQSFLGQASKSLLKTLRSLAPTSNVLGNTPTSTIVALHKKHTTSYITPPLSFEKASETLQESSGGGQVYLSRHLRTNKTYVVKHTEPAPPSERSHPPTESYVIESILKPHPNIIYHNETIHDSSNPGRHYIVLEYCSGGDLFNQLSYWWLTRKTHVPTLFLLHTVVELFDAFAYIHHGLRHVGGGKYTRDKGHRPVIHNDTKGENIFLKNSTDAIGGLPSLILADFGHARVVGETLYETGAGTPNYFSPEDQEIIQQAREAGKLEKDEDICEVYYSVSRNRTTAADIYSLGHVLYIMAANSGFNRERISRWPIGKDPLKLKISPEYLAVDGLLEIVQKCLIPDVGKRASADFDPKTGVLPLVHQLRQVRDEMIRKGERLPRAEWLQPPSESS
ncbi:hypothetical protein CKM354_001016200 [Cercospora kikuchii]|uniref:non-specific serine/threonine protein kinase n=1 Tax=Cercospora kikuchii TaxID=84275 RepID=A0A9P3CR01_9PEZI|nr:uncharacterized protein CKM354_001016200 [Cercospora kikuchii]GIZ47061.1 hypothetical protein CKM354_001016200 [Cercospora kikuchii]